MEHISRYDHVFQRHAKAGIQVFAFDQRGFGQTAQATNTQGQTTWSHALDDIEFFINLKSADPPNPSVKVFLMGHSMGGGLTYAYASSKRTSLNLITGGFILSSPLIRQAPGVKAWFPVVLIGGWIGSLIPKLPIKVGVAPEDISRDPVVQEEYAHDPLCPPQATLKGVSDMLLGGEGLLQRGYLSYPESKSILAVHGTGDKVTDHDATHELLQKTKSSDKTFKSFEGYYHEMHNEPGDDKWNEIMFIVDWIKSRSKL